MTHSADFSEDTAAAVGFAGDEFMNKRTQHTTKNTFRKEKFTIG